MTSRSHEDWNKTRMLQSKVKHSFLIKLSRIRNNTRQFLPARLAIFVSALWSFGGGETISANNPFISRMRSFFLKRLEGNLGNEVLEIPESPFTLFKVLTVPDGIATAVLFLPLHRLKLDMILKWTSLICSSVSGSSWTKVLFCTTTGFFLLFLRLVFFFRTKVSCSGFLVFSTFISRDLTRGARIVDFTSKLLAWTSPLVIGREFVFLIRFVFPIDCFLLFKLIILISINVDAPLIIPLVYWPYSCGKPKLKWASMKTENSIHLEDIGITFISFL